MTKANATRKSTRRRITKRFHDDKPSLSESTDFRSILNRLESISGVRVLVPV